MNILGFNVTRAARETPADLALAAAAEARQSSQTGTLANPPGWLREALGGTPTAAGVTVTEHTAMNLSAVFGCVRVLSEDVSSLPFKVYRKGRTGREEASDHPVYEVLHRQANPLMSAMVFRELMELYVTLWGNAYAEIQRDGRGDVVALWPIAPWLVEVLRGEDGVRPVRRYKVAGVDRPFREDEVFHVQGPGFDGLKGKSPIRMMREALGLAVQAERYGGRFFANDARAGVYITHPGQLEEEVYERLKAGVNGDHQGADKAWRVQILEEGMTPHQIGLPLGDAQFIETRKFQLVEVCRWYRMPPHKVQDLEKATFSNIEHQGLEYVMGTLRPWLVRFEQAAWMQLLGGDDRLYAQHNVDALLRGDIKSRYEAYAVGRQWGFLSADDIRAREDMNALPDGQGDVYLQPLNMVPAGTDPFADEGDGSRRLPAELRGARAAGNGGVERRAQPARVATAKAIEPLLRSTFARAVRREAAEVRRALREHAEGGRMDEFGDWVVGFADDQAEWMEPRVLPAFQAMAEAMVEAARDELGEDVSVEDLDSFVREYVAASARRHAGATRGQVLALLDEHTDDEGELDGAAADGAVRQRLDEWEDGTDAGTRAEKEARRERRRSASAITQAAWVLAGVTAHTWRTSGKSCPLCDGLEGMTVELTRAFVQAGETVGEGETTITTSSRVQHPPLHDGCDCYTVASTGRRRRPTGAEARSLLGAILRAAFPDGDVGDVAESRSSVEAPSAVAPSALDRRDDEIRQSYPALKAEAGAYPARLELAERHAISEKQVRRILFEGGRS